MEKNILIVEDKEATLRMLEKLIREDVGGVAVFLARDYESALREAVLRNIDVFLIDIVLDTAVTDASGMRFAKRVREDENYLFTPIIFITGLEDPRLYAYKELHSFGYIEKPFAKENVVELPTASVAEAAKEEKAEEAAPEKEKSRAEAEDDGFLEIMKFFKK